MEELYPAVDRLKPQITSLLTTSDKILSSESLKEFFAYILTLGNFINMVSSHPHRSEKLSLGVN